MFLTFDTWDWQGDCESVDDGVWWFQSQPDRRPIDWFSPHPSKIFMKITFGHQVITFVGKFQVKLWKISLEQKQHNMSVNWGPVDRYEPGGPLKRFSTLWDEFLMKHTMYGSLKYDLCLFLPRMPTTLPCLRVLVLVLLRSVANGSQRVVGRNLKGGDGSLLGGWEERHRRAPPDAEEGGGRDSGEVEIQELICKKFLGRAATLFNMQCSAPSVPWARKDLILCLSLLRGLILRMRYS